MRYLKKVYFYKKRHSLLYKLHALLQELRAPLQQQNVCSVTKMYVCCFLTYLQSLKISPLQYQNAFYAPDSAGRKFLNINLYIMINLKDHHSFRSCKLDMVHITSTIDEKSCTTYWIRIYFSTLIVRFSNKFKIKETLFRNIYIYI